MASWMLICHLILYSLVAALPNHHPYVASQYKYDHDLTAYCDLVPANPDGSVRGRIILRQSGPSDPVLVNVTVTGLPVSYSSLTSKHGFHIHEYGSTADACKAAGAHFNPYSNPHGSPSDLFRPHHLGDLGNIIAWKGSSSTAFYSYGITLFPRETNSILGRSFVVHENADDLGKGGNLESLKTGNAGARLACCVILPATQQYH